MASNLVVVILLTVVALVFTAIALIWTVAFVPTFSLSGCWMSAQSQVKRLATLYIEGIFSSEDFERELSLGTCVEKIQFANKPEAYCHGEPVTGICAFGNKGYIIVCRNPKGGGIIGKVEARFKATKDLCYGVSKPFSAELTLEGGADYCIEVKGTGDSYIVSKKAVGKCKSS